MSRITIQGWIGVAAALHAGEARAEKSMAKVGMKMRMCKTKKGPGILFPLSPADVVPIGAGQGSFDDASPWNNGSSFPLPGNIVSRLANPSSLLGLSCSLYHAVEIPIWVLIE